MASHSPKSLLRLPLLGLSLLVAAPGCVTTPRAVPAPAPAPSSAPLPEQAIAPQVEEAPVPTCPDTIRREEKLELGAERVPGAGTFLDAERTGALGAAAARLERTVELVGGAVDLVAWSRGPEASLAVLRREAGGHCVVNSWGSYLEPSVSLSLADVWTSADRRYAVLLVQLKLREGTGEQSPVRETRWVVLATDGARVWPALVDKAGMMMQAIAPSMVFQTRKGQLQLAITHTNTRLLAFEPKRGLFVF